MQHAPKEWDFFFEERSSPFGTDPNVMSLAQAAASALALRGWQDKDTQTLVAKWQSAHGAGLAVDGHYGPASAKALAQDLGEASPPAYAKVGQAPATASYIAPISLAALPPPPPPPSVPPPPAPAAAPSIASAPSTDPATLAAAARNVADVVASPPVNRGLSELAIEAESGLVTHGWKDPLVQRAVASWQKAHGGGLKVDGIYGPASAAVLGGDIGGPAVPAFYLPGAPMEAAPAPAPARAVASAPSKRVAPGSSRAPGSLVLGSAAPSSLSSSVHQAFQKPWVKGSVAIAVGGAVAFGAMKLYGHKKKGKKS